MLPFVLSDIYTDKPDTGLRAVLRRIRDWFRQISGRPAGRSGDGAPDAAGTSEEAENLYRQGIYAEKNAFGLIGQRGKEYFVQAAAKGHAASSFHLRFAEYCAAAVPYKGFCSDDRVKAWLEAEAQKGNVEACYILGKLCQCDLRSDGSRLVRYWVNDENYERDCFLKAAENGHVPAQYELGCWYETHSSACDDTDCSGEACKWMTKAAEAGFLPAQTRLAAYFSTGDLVSRDEEESFRWYYKAAMQEDEAAQYEVAECYREGCGVEPDIDKAVEWYIRSKNYQKSKWALEELGVEV